MVKTLKWVEILVLKGLYGEDEQLMPSQPTLKHVEKIRGIRWRQKTQAPTPQAPVRNRQTRKVANA